MAYAGHILVPKIVTGRALLEKAALTIADLTTDGGFLLPEQAKTFMRLMIKGSTLLPGVMARAMASHSEEVSQLAFSSRIMRPGIEATALGPSDRAKPDTSKVLIETKEIKADIPLNDHVLEDNVEGPALQRTIMSLIGGAAGRDVEELIVNGDTGSGDSYLALFDGLRKLATSNIVDFDSEEVNGDDLNSMLKAMPVRYRTLRRDMRFYTNDDVVQDWRKQLSNRSTAVGDRFLIEDVPVVYGGVPFLQVPVWPDDLGGGSDQSDIILTWPKNIAYGIWRDIRIETDRDIRAGELIIVVTMRVGVEYFEEEGVVKGTTVQIA